MGTHSDISDLIKRELLIVTIPSMWRWHVLKALSHANAVDVSIRIAFDFEENGALHWIGRPLSLMS